MNSMVESATTIAMAVIGLAVVAVLVSKKANTAGVVQSLASGLGNTIGVAQSPVSGTNVSLNLSYPSSSLGYSFGS